MTRSDVFYGVAWFLFFSLFILCIFVEKIEWIEKEEKFWKNYWKCVFYEKNRKEEKKINEKFQN